MSKEEPYGSIGNLSNIYYYFTKDNCYPDSITLWYVNMTLNVYIHNQEYYFFTCGAKNPYPHIHVKTGIHVSVRDISHQSHTD